MQASRLSPQLARSGLGSFARWYSFEKVPTWHACSALARGEVIRKTPHRRTTRFFHFLLFFDQRYWLPWPLCLRSASGIQCWQSARQTEKPTTNRRMIPKIRNSYVTSVVAGGLVVTYAVSPLIGLSAVPNFSR